MLDDVERRRVPEQPAREHLAPGKRPAGAGALLDEDLDEGAHFGRAFPRQRPLASGEADDDVADPARFARLHHQILRLVVALVEQAERGDAILDRGTELALDRRQTDRRGGDRLGHLGRGGPRLVTVAALAPGERDKRHEDERPAHRDQASGDQAW